jgi:D-amino-acid dehydrogenase
LHPRVKRRRINAIHATARSYLCGWDDATLLEPWVGLRPMTSDGLPVIGSIPRLENAYVASGHAMLGVTLGPATGKHLAHLIHTGEAPKIIKPFTPARFSGKWRGPNTQEGPI